MFKGPPPPKKNMCVSGYPTLPNFLGPKIPTLSFFFFTIFGEKIKFQNLNQTWEVIYCSLIRIKILVITMIKICNKQYNVISLWASLWSISVVVGGSFIVFAFLHLKDDYFLIILFIDNLSNSYSTAFYGQLYNGKIFIKVYIRIEFPT